MNNFFKYALSAVAFIAFSLTLSFGLSQTSATPAQADTSCSGTSICISLHKGWTGNSHNSSVGSGPGGGGTGGGGGNTSTVTKPNTPKCVNRSGGTMYTIGLKDPFPFANTAWGTLKGCVKEYDTKVTFVDFGSPGGWCPVGSQGVKAVGYINSIVSRVQFAERVDDEKMGAGGKVFYSYKVSGSANNCIYPKVKSKVTNKYCALSASGTLDRLANSRAGAGRVKTFNKTIASVAGLKSGSATCQQSANLSFASGMKSNESTWGQYKMSGTIKYVRCTEYTVSFDGKSRKEYNTCSGVQTSQASPAYLTLWCAGFKRSLINKSWTMNDCLTPGSGATPPTGTNPPIGGTPPTTISRGKFSCTVPKATFDGKTGTVQTLRDGKGRVLNWGTPKTSSSVRATTNWRQAVTVNSGSSPRIASVSDNSKSQQMFWSNATFGSSWVARKNQQNVGFYNASNPGTSWSATRKLKFDGQFRTVVSDITSFDPWTGKSTSVDRVVWVSDRNINCSSAVSPNVQALRSVGDAQQ